VSDAAAERVVALYQRHAAAFDAARGRHLHERGWLDRFADLAGPGTDLLDIGCGAGDPIARYLIKRGHRITGVDSAPQLLALAGARFPDHTWIEADMRSLALGRHFGGLIAWCSLFHLIAQAQRAMVPILAAHALPGAPLLFTSGPATGEAIGTFEGEPLYHASLDPGDYRDLLGDAGFEVVDHVPEDATCGGLTVWLARKRV
jgi:SAM-dependent methyltransferase